MCHNMCSDCSREHRAAAAGAVRAAVRGAAVSGQQCVRPPHQQCVCRVCGVHCQEEYWHAPQHTASGHVRCFPAPFPRMACQIPSCKCQLCYSLQICDLLRLGAPHCHSCKFHIACRLQIVRAPALPESTERSHALSQILRCWSPRTLRCCTLWRRTWRPTRRTAPWQPSMLATSSQRCGSCLSFLASVRAVQSRVVLLFVCFMIAVAQKSA